MADQIIIDGGRLLYNSTTGFASSANRGFTLGSGGAEIAVAGSGTMTINGPITGPGQLVKTGPTNLSISNSANNYSGGTLVAEGNLRIGHTNSLGTGTVQLGVPGGPSVGLISYLAGWNYTNAITVPAGVAGTVTLGDVSTSNVYNTIYSGPITLNGPVTITSSAPEGLRLTFNGVLSGTGDVTKVGPGQWRLNNGNTWTGNLNIVEGSVYLTSAGELRFALADDGLSNIIGGVGTAEFDGLFRIDPTALTTMVGSWQLVDVDTLASVSFLSNFGLALLDGTAFVAQGGGIFTAGDFTFDTGTGTLTLIPEPGTYAALASVAALGLAAWRRRRS